MSTFCGECGKEIEEGCAFCSVCGTPVSAEAPSPTPAYEEPVRAETPVSAQPARKAATNKIDPTHVDFFLATKGKSLPAERLPAIREQLLNMEESKAIVIQSLELKDTTTMLIISLFLGTFGVDRFMLSQIGMGVLKLLTGGLCGILTIIDWVTIQNKTREFNYNRLMTALSLNPAYAATAPLPAMTTAPIGNAAAEPQVNANTKQGGKQAAGGAASAPQPIYIPTAENEAGVMKSLPVFLKAFFKKPFTAVVASPLNLPDGLILAGVHAVAFAFFSLVIMSGIGKMSYSLGFRFGGGVKIFFLSLLLSIAATAAFAGLHLLFGKAVFKGTIDGGLKKLFPLVVATETPLIAATLLAVIFTFVFPPISVLLLAFGVIAAIALSSAVFVGEMKLSHDAGVFASIFTYTAQMVVLCILFLILLF